MFQSGTRQHALSYRYTQDECGSYRVDVRLEAKNKITVLELDLDAGTNVNFDMKIQPIHVAGLTDHPSKRRRASRLHCHKLEGAEHRRPNRWNADQSRQNARQHPLVPLYIFLFIAHNPDASDIRAFLILIDLSCRIYADSFFS